MKMITGVDILDEEIKEKLRTENIYKIFNNFIFPLITEEERENKITHRKHLQDFQ